MIINNFDIEKARTETPAVASLIHLNNAGSSLMPACVLDATIGYLKRESEIGGYETARERTGQLEAFYDSVATLISCKREEVSFVESSTRGWDLAFYSLNFRKGDRILTAMSEYGSNYITFLHVQEKFGVKIDIIPNEPNGQLSLSALKDMLDERVKLISVTHVPATSGLVNPVEAVGKIARSINAIYLVDATQSVGQIPINVRAIGCHILVGTGRKFLRGPRGTGFLFMDLDLLKQTIPVFLDNRAAKLVERDRYEIYPSGRRFEAFEYNFAGKAGLGAAIDYALSWGLDAIWTRVKSLADSLREQLRSIPRINILDMGNELCGIVSFNIESIDANLVCKILNTKSMNICVMELNDAPLEITSRALGEFLRASVHYFNTEQEIQTFCKQIESIIEHES